MGCLRAICGHQIGHFHINTVSTGGSSPLAKPHVPVKPPVVVEQVQKPDNSRAKMTVKRPLRKLKGEAEKQGVK